MSNLLDNTKIEQHEINTEMSKSYIDYAMSVIVGRALPDVRDGLKPVHRRIIYGMDQMGVTPDKPYKKSARIVGDVMSKYHPHGDSSIYDAMVRMAQDFSQRYMLVDGHGNFGSIDGDGAAAHRYTEAKMSKHTLEMLRDIDKDTVDFKDNFDGEEKEPVVLPSRFPNLLANGSNGIAVGMATSIPPHNLSEVIDAAIYLLDNPEGTVDDLMEIIKGPDFPTGAKIIGKSGMRQAYRTGTGKVIVRSCCEIEETDRGKSQIIVSAIPYQVNKARLIEKIAELVKEKRVDGISAIRDETSSREGIRIVIELKRDANPQITLNRLYKHTQLQDSYSMIMLALVDGQPKILNLKEILSEYTKFQKEIVTRRTRFDLKKAEDRAHILDGLKIALDNIDEVIKTIRTAYSDAKEKLMEKFNLSEIQAQAILNMRLVRLQGLEREKIENEYNELMEKIAYFKSILADENLLISIIKDELTEIKEKLGDERRTSIEKDETEFDDEDLVEEENVAITLTHLGYIKRVPADTYKAQKRGGKGITGITTRENDFVRDLIMTSTHDHLLFFTNLGKAHKIKAYEIPEATRTAKGTPAINFLNLMQRERIATIIPVQEFSEDKYLLAITKNGTIKKTALSAFSSIRKNGLIAINLKDDDKLICMREISDNDEVVIVTKKGMSIRISETDVREMGRNASGVRGIKLEGDDEVVAMEIVSPGKQLLVATAGGYGKRTNIKEYKLQGRGGKGVLTYDKSKFKKTGELIGAMAVEEDDEILMINSDGVIIRIRASEVSVLSRTTQGVKIMKVEDDTKIVAMAKMIKNNDDDQSEEEKDIQLTL